VARKRGGSSETLREYWTGEGHPGPSGGRFAAEIAWGTPGDFARCVAQVTAHGKMTPEQAKGYCNLRHHEATGMWTAQHAREERGKMTVISELIFADDALLRVGEALKAYNPSEARITSGTGGGEFTAGGGGGAAPVPAQPAAQPAAQPSGQSSAAQERQQDAAHVAHLRHEIHGLEMTLGQLQKMKASLGPKNRGTGATVKKPPKGGATAAKPAATAAKPGAAASGKPKKPSKGGSSARLTAINQQIASVKQQIAQLRQQLAAAVAEKVLKALKEKKEKPTPIVVDGEGDKDHDGDGLFDADGDGDGAVARRLDKVGPHGYEHGWIKVGAPGASHHSHETGDLPDKLQVGAFNYQKQADGTYTRHHPGSGRRAQSSIDAGYYSADKIKQISRAQDGKGRYHSPIRLVSSVKEPKTDTRFDPRPARSRATTTTTQHDGDTFIHHQVPGGLLGQGKNVRNPRDVPSGRFRTFQGEITEAKQALAEGRVSDVVELLGSARALAQDDRQRMVLGELQAAIGRTQHITPDLTKSQAPRFTGAMDEVKVGPKGYEHGWIKVGEGTARSRGMRKGDTVAADRHDGSGAVVGIHDGAKGGYVSIRNPASGETHRVPHEAVRPALGIENNQLMARMGQGAKIEDRTPADDRATGEQVARELTQYGSGGMEAGTADFSDEELEHAWQHLSEKKDRTSEEDEALNVLESHFAEDDYPIESDEDAYGVEGISSRDLAAMRRGEMP